MMDAPVSGGEPKAIDGTLAFMVGGQPEVFEKVKPILENNGFFRRALRGYRRGQRRPSCATRSSSR